MRNFPQVGPRDALKWVAVDLDKTLAQGVWTPEDPSPNIGDPIWENVAKLNELIDEGFKIIIHTSRGWTYYEAIESWCNFWGIHFDNIVCGKLLSLMYIDDRAINANEESWLPKAHGIT